MTRQIPGEGAADLPLAVRLAVVDWAADTLGVLPAAQVPAALTQVARFTPRKRARSGAAALLRTVEADAAFRAAVAERARAVTNDLDAGADGVRAAALAHLLRSAQEEELMRPLRAEGAPATSEAHQLRAAVAHLQRELARMRTEREQAVARGAGGRSGDGADEPDKLRRRLREQGIRLRENEQSAAADRARLEREIDSLRSEIVRLTEEVSTGQERLRATGERADRAQESLGRLREQAGGQRATADRRLDLLLVTAEGALTGLRREWNLAGGGLDPADVVAQRLPGAGALPEGTTEPSRLHSWLTLPAAHLVVDGYNVTKTGYPELTLAQQRDRLVRSLAALAARTSAEVTVVFDGAAVAVPAAPSRGVRVLFSPAGVLADDVIRDLVAAEPVGRVIVVVSSDQEVADGVRRRGARTAGSAVLLGLVG